MIHALLAALAVIDGTAEAVFPISGAAAARAVRSIWLRHGLAIFKRRLKALEAKAAEDGLAAGRDSGPGGAQVQALEKKTLDDQA